MFAYKIDNQLCRVLRGDIRRINQFARMVKLLATVDRVFGTGAQFVEVDHDSSIRVFDVLQSALGETPLLQFFHRIAIRNPAKFIETSGRAPSAAIDPMLKSSIKRRAINPSLSARNNFQGARWIGELSSLP